MKDIEDKIIKYLDSDKRTLFDGAGRNYFIYISYFFVLMTIILAFLSIVSIFSKAPIKIVIINIFGFFGALSYYFMFKTIKTIPPKVEKAEWLWRNGKKAYLLCLLANIFLSLAYLFSPISLNNAIFCVVDLLILGVIIGIIFQIIRKPELLLSGKLTQLGSILICLIPIFFGFSIIDFDLVSLKFWIYLLFWLSIFCLLVYRAQNSRLNFIQSIIIKFARPEIILSAFRNANEKIKEKIKALRILDKIKDEERFGVEQFLLLELTEKYSSRTSTLWSLSIALILFILGASIGGLIEFFMQDVIYLPYLKDTLCKYFKCKV